MGYNYYGQLGDGSTTIRSTPIEIESSGVLSVSGGSSHSLYVKSDGSLWGMGRNSSGQLGDGSTTNRSTPAEVVTVVSNQAPTDLNSSAFLTILENQIVGTEVGDFNATDPDENATLIYSLVSGVGDSNNSLFTMESNGSLKTAVVFDYESNASTYSIRVEAKDEFNATVEGNFTVSLLDGLNGVLILNSSAGGSVTGAGSYDQGSKAMLSATPDLGYLFQGWVGGKNSMEAEVSLTMSGDFEVNATFVQDSADTDGDGLTNYAELVTTLTDPNDSDSDDDTISDFDEYQIGLNPNSANTALVAYYNNREATARTDGNTSGIAYVQGNLSIYSLYTEAEKNASDTTQYASGVSDGNTGGIAYVQANLSSYSLYTETEKNASDTAQYASGKTAGSAEGLATVQADLASQGLSLLTYLNQMSAGTPHTHNWYFQPEWGWMWTSKDQFPYVYLAGVGESPGTWLYFGQIPDQEEASFYNYTTKSWITPSSVE